MPTQAATQSNTEQVGWMHVRETIRMLFLAIAQIEIALRESDDSVDHLTEVFTSMVDRENEIKQSIESLSSDDCEEALRQDIKDNVDSVTAKMQSAIVAFQFYDKLTQRLTHVASSMEELSNLLDDESRIEVIEEWQGLQSTIKSRYSMREEFELFNAVISGADVRDAIRRYNETSKADNIDDIEMF